MSHSFKTISDKDLDCEVVYFTNANLIIDSGFKFKDFKIAYKTYGKLNSEKTNAILVCHALTGDQYVAEKNPITNKNGWWNKMVGPN